MWRFLTGIRKDMQLRKTSFSQGNAGSQVAAPRRYRELEQVSNIQLNVTQLLKFNVLASYSTFVIIYINNNFLLRRFSHLILSSLQLFYMFYSM
jgi:hypothetical protein